MLVDGCEWGDETRVLLALADALGADAPCVAVLYGGGAVARREALGHCRAGRPLVVVGGSGRLADELAASAAAGSPPAAADVDEMLATGNVIIWAPGVDEDVAGCLRAALSGVGG